MFNDALLYANGFDMRILLVEDNPDVRSFLARALAGISPQAEVIPVEHGLAALDTLGQVGVDVIISDQHMPQMSGLELLAAVRVASAVPFVLISADSAIAEAAYAAGASWFLHKPFSLHVLHQVVQNLACAV